MAIKDEEYKLMQTEESKDNQSASYDVSTFS